MTPQEEILVRHLIAMIQADGIIKPEETGLLAQVLGRMKLEPTDIAAAGRWLGEPQSVDGEQLRSAFNEPEERELVTGLLLELAQADSMIGHEEIRLLDQLATALAAPR